MTLQDYFNLIANSLSNYISFKSTIIVPTVAALIIFIVGLLVASVLRQVWVEILKFLNIEKNLSKNSAYANLVKSNKTLSLTELVGSLIWWSAVLVFLLPTLKALGLNQVDQTVATIFGFLPTAIAGGTYLFLGSVVAWFTYLFVLAVGNLTKISTASALAKTVAGAIIVFSLLAALRTFGISAEMIRFIILATLAAGALSFGLAGKDLAADILKKVRELIK